MTKPPPLRASHHKDAPRAARPIVYDASHLTSRLSAAAFTGIDFVDRAFARHYCAPHSVACGAHYGLTGPHVLAPHRIAELSACHEKSVGVASADAAANWRALKLWLHAPQGARFNASPAEKRAPDMRAALLTTRLRLAHDKPWRIPRDAVYLNVAQYGFEHALLFRWLDRRPDVKPVFFSHDLLPLDHPEYFRDGYREIFHRRFRTILTRAAAIVTTTRTVKARICAEYERQGRPPPPILAQPLPSPLRDADADESGAELANAPPYVVMIGTLEPRKNYALMLEVWRRLSASSSTPPKLVCVGGRGWNGAHDGELTAAVEALGGRAALASGLPAPALRALLAHARALAAPSFAEGYGIPLVEALTLGVPTICSDIEAFRETSQGCATFVSPHDVEAWTQRILDLADPEHLNAARNAAKNFRAPDWPHYFAGIDAFLGSL
jgi:glycosyltransferase involved in cell wall biosynthesis